METYLVYCDETGDDGLINRSSDDFVLTSVYMNSNSWQNNYIKIKQLRQFLKTQYGFHVIEEMHTKNFLTDKDPYRKYCWSVEQKLQILNWFVKCIAEHLDIKIVNVIIDKTAITDNNYNILNTALSYSIQRIENDSKNQWNYIIITDKGRIKPMRKCAREIRAFNFIPSHYDNSYNRPISGLLEDVLEKDSSESYFIQICDFISYFTHLYFTCNMKGGNIPNRAANLIDKHYIENGLNEFRDNGKLNLNASKDNQYGIVIYPKRK